MDQWPLTFNCTVMCVTIACIHCNVETVGSRTLECHLQCGGHLGQSLSDQKNICLRVKDHKLQCMVPNTSPCLCAQLEVELESRTLGKPAPDPVEGRMVVETMTGHWMTAPVLLTKLEFSSSDNVLSLRG